MIERAQVVVDLGALRDNARKILERSGARRLLPMVKANAYGVGAVPVAGALEALDPWGYGVATVEEGRELREAGITRPLVVFTPADTDAGDRYRELDLRAVLDRRETIRNWELPFHLEIDTGMSRSGIRWDDREELEAARSGFMEGVFTHFHSADSDPDSVLQQWQRFRDALMHLGERPPLVHAANSAGAFRLDVPLDLARPGIFLYGGRVGPGLPEPQPVVSLRSRVVSIRRIKAGDTVSYGGCWTARRDSTVATLGIGYADGLRRAVEGKAWVLVRGSRCPVIGKITMDLTMIDVTDVAGVSVGEPVTLLGADDGEMITVDQMASWADTISFEILTGLGSRLVRIYEEA